MQKIIRIWDKTEEILVVVLIGIAAYLTFQEVVLRYVFNTGWSGSYEITVMALIWCTFIGASLGIKENIHIGVDVLVVKFGPKTQRILITVSIALCLLFGIIVAVKGFEFAKFISRNRLLSRDLRIPMEIGYLAIPVGGVLVSLRFIERLVYVLKGELFEIDRMHELSEEEKKKLVHTPDD
ncbi:MAG: TRAP transporter small permease [Desulfobacterales bacterium]|uniref:TRAP transporter small permease n=1 Tax=Candidatus Desulfatibia vada TaxID=2841696 RepID=A0A8J6TP04_9BACT|nr:TRAP transporter small permease [Candidatus Desulfatibia vada]